MISQLRSSLTAQLHHLGIPAQSQALVINAIETGQIPKNTTAYAGFGQIVQEVIGAAYTAFHDGLHAALYLSAGLALAAGLLAFITLPSRPAADENFTVLPRQHDQDLHDDLQEELCLVPTALVNHRPAPCVGFGVVIVVVLVSAGAARMTRTRSTRSPRRRSRYQLDRHCSGVRPRASRRSFARRSRTFPGVLIFTKCGMLWDSASP